MELTEISDRIDVMLNAFELPIEIDEYEKSIYLTKAQQVIYRQLCDAFEIDGNIHHYLQPFLKDFATTYPVEIVEKEHLIKNAVSIVVPSDIFRIVLEKAYIASTDTQFNNREVKILKSRLSEIPYKEDNPFRKPNEKEILRIADVNESEDLFELILPDNSELIRYQCRYLPLVDPIILEALPDGLTIDNQTGPLNSLFDDEVIEQIIELTVLSIKQDRAANQNV